MLSNSQHKAFMTLVRQIRKLPAFTKLHVRFEKIEDAHGYAFLHEDGRQVVKINRDLDWSTAIETLAHELAHLLVDMDDEHNRLFHVMNEAMIEVIFVLIGDELR